MNEIEIKLRIVQALSNFSSGTLLENGIALLNTLGYHSDRQVNLSPNTFEGLVDIHPPISGINKTKALVDEWLSVDILFQLTGTDIRQASQGRFLFDDTRRVDNQIIESYLFVTIELMGAEYTRSKLADLTREVNKFFAMPVMVLFKYGEQVTLSIINRRLNKREENKDVLEKVTLIKNVNFFDPLRAHIEILFDLSLGQLQNQFGFQNFVDLHRAWLKTLDTSELNKRFYREIANWYFWAVSTVKFPPGTSDEVETRNATNVIRLITRIIFVWFIKEKGLVLDDLFNLQRLKDIVHFTDPNNSTYYKAILQNLFFATLNTEMGDGRRFRGKNNNPNGRDSHYGVSTVYRYENYFRDPQAALKLFAGIPFLNGGLFECLDKREEKIIIDGFSDDPRNQPIVPDELFFGDEQSIDLNEVYGDRNHGREKVRGLINIFNHYKFTIEENTPLEEEIALDPELLGQVFENLLAAYNPETGATARKQTGSFYTPREIVNYMVDEALLAYFNTQFGDRFNCESNLRQFFNYNIDTNLFDNKETCLLIEAIDKIKVLDPACGSGAFPMGVLHKLVMLLKKLDPENIYWKELQRQKAIIETENAYKIGDQSERRQRLLDIDEAFENNSSNYGRKLYLIENCIYGVDIQSIAVQIAKLRFFISLIVDQEIDQTRINLGIRPLPNLETKFVAANVLITSELSRSGKPISINFSDHLIEEQRNRLKEIRHKIFFSRSHTTKMKYKEEDRNIRESMTDILNQDWNNSFANELANWDPYDQNNHAGFFDTEWMFGITAGFDIVISNPPWVSLLGKHGIDDNKNSKEIYLKIYDVNTYMPNLYEFFIQRGLALLDKYGILCYILPDRFGYNKSFINLRKKILSNNKILQVVYRWNFENVIADTMTLLLRKEYSHDYMISIRNRPEEEPLLLAKSQLMKTDKVEIRGYSNNDTKLLLEKIQQRSSPLVNFAKTTSGFGGKSSIITTSRINENQIPVLKGSSIQRFSIIKTFYFDFINENLTGRTRDQNKLGKLEKILIRKTGDKLIATYEDTGIFPEQSLYFLYDFRENISPKYLLGLLNSNIITWFYQNFLITNKDSTPQLKNYDLDRIPIILSSEQDSIINIVDDILRTKRSDISANIDSLEARLNELIFTIYGLTQNEIALIKNELNKI